MYERILVPTDGSESADAVIEHAMGIGVPNDAEVHAIYVINTGALPSPDVEFRREFIEEGERIGEEAVDAVAAVASEAGLEAVTTITRGTPYEEIIEYANEHEIDLIVMGTHGRTGLRHFLLGSVAERVIRHAGSPVLLIRIGD